MKKDILGLNPKDYKYVSSDNKSTTLRHKKGHTITIAHNVISPGARATLEAVANAHEATRKKEAEGGFMPTSVTGYEEGGRVPAPAQDTGEQDKQKRAQQMSQGAQQSGGLPDADTLLNRLKNAWAKGGQVYPEGSRAGNEEGVRKQPHGGGGKSLSGHELDKAKANPQHADVHKQNAKHLSKENLEALKKMPKPKLAEGGEVSQEELEGLPGWFHDAGQDQSHPQHMSHQDMNDEKNYAYDAGLPCLNPHCRSQGKPHPNCRCYSGGEGFAEGGEVQKLRYCAHGKPHMDDCEYSKGISEQGKDVRYGNKSHDSSDKEMASHWAKEEAKGRAEFERKAVKPKLKGLAEGGGPEDAPDMPHKESFLDTERRLTKEASAADHYREAARLAEKAGDSAGPSQGAQGLPPDPNFNSVTGQYQQPAQAAAPAQAQPAPQDAQQPQAQPEEAPQDPAQQVAGNVGQPSAQSMNDTQIPASGAAQPQIQSQPPSMADHIMAENQAFEHDLNNGHITPKTYNDLMFYNKDGSEKSTLGKIGSIFGLMISGAGAGLAHQPIMALHMMDNVIKNDLDAQQKSKENAQNFLRINQNRLLNDANVKSVLASANYTAAQKADLVQKIQSQAYGLSYMQMASAAFHNQMEKLKTMQPGTPAYQQAAQAAMLMGDAINKNNSATAAALGQGGSSALGMYGMSAPGQEGQAPQNPEEKFKNDMQMLELTGQKDKADSLRARHIPGIPGFASRDIPEDKRNQLTAMSILDDKVNDVLNFARQHRGSVDPRILQQGRQKAEELTSFYNKSVDNLGMTQGRLGWLEEQIKKNPTSLIQQILGNNARLEEIRDSNAHRKDIESNKLGFPVNPGGPSTAPKEQLSKSGKPIQLNPQTGKWEYK